MVFCVSSKESVYWEAFKQFYRLIYAVPTSILYVIVLYSIRRQTKYYAPVYIKLFTMASIMNLVAWWLDFFFTDILGYNKWCRFWSVLSGTYWFIVPFFVSYASAIGCFMVSTFISLYQLALIVFPLDAEARFKRAFPWIVVLVFVLPILCCLHILISTINLIPLSPFMIYLRIAHVFKELDFITITVTNMVLGSVCIVIICISTLISVVRYWKIRTKSHRAVKLRIFTVNLYMTLATVIYILFQAFIFYSRIIKDDYRLLFTVYRYRGIFSDICYLPIPWIVIILNVRIRKSVFKFWEHKSSTIVSVIPGSSSVY